MGRAPRESVEIEVNSDIVSVSILSEVAKISGRQARLGSREPA